MTPRPVTSHAVTSPAQIRPAPVLVVVGAVNVDLVVTAPRLPGPGETVVGAGLVSHGGGKGANAAVAAARLGGQVALVGAVGEDDHGTGALAELVEDGVDVTAVRRLSTVPTGVALIVVDEAGENQIAVGAGANAAVDAGDVRAALARLADRAGCVLVSTEIAGTAVVAAVELAAAEGLRCVLNPAPPIDEVVDALAWGPIVTPNEAEALALARLLGAAPQGPAAVSDAAAVISAASGAPVIVTRGAAGVWLHDAHGARAVPAPRVRVRDTTGAGDTFNGVLSSRLAAGEELDDAVRTAVLAASLSVTQPGARGGMPTALQLAAGVGPS